MTRLITLDEDDLRQALSDEVLVEALARALIASKPNLGQQLWHELREGIVRAIVKQWERELVEHHR